MSRIPVAIAGASGYTGSELVRLLRGHPQVELVACSSRSRVGQPFSAIHPAFAGLHDDALVSQEELAARIVAEGLSVRATEEAVTLANRGGTRPSGPQRRKPIQMPGLQDVAERLSGTYDTRVTVSLGKRKGRIVVEFGSVDDLQRIVGLMDPETSG